MDCPGQLRPWHELLCVIFSSRLVVVPDATTHERRICRLYLVRHVTAVTERHSPERTPRPRLTEIGTVPLPPSRPAATWAKLSRTAP